MSIESPTDGVPAEHWLRQSDAAASFVPSEGFCCTALRIRDGEGWWSVLAEPPTWERLRARPAFYGSPLLFPFPLRVSGNGFEYRGRRHSLAPGRDGRVVHGLVRDHPWAVERAWTDGAGDHLRAAITTAGEPDLLAQFPFPFRLSATYTLSGRTLGLEVEAVNLGESPMPFGLGVHPYFPTPLVPGGRLEDEIVRSDVTHVVQAAPDGNVLALEPAAGGLDLRPGRPLAEFLAAQDALIGSGRRGAATQYAVPGALGAAASDAPGVSWALRNVTTGHCVRVETSAAFGALVLFVPRPPTVVSPVPCTCLADAFNLASHGQVSGVVELEPGATWRAWTRLSAGHERAAGA